MGLQINYDVIKLQEY